jgi:hypothetical protein
VTPWSLNNTSMNEDLTDRLRFGGKALTYLRPPRTP